MHYGSDILTRTGNTCIMTAEGHSISSVSTVEQTFFLSFTTNIGDHDQTTAPSIKCINPFHSSCKYKQELMNHHGEKERWTSVPILCIITLQNVPYIDYKLLVLTSFVVATVTTMDSQESACCDNSHLLGFLMK